MEKCTVAEIEEKRLVAISRKEESVMKQCRSVVNFLVAKTVKVEQQEKMDFWKRDGESKYFNNMIGTNDDSFVLEAVEDLELLGIAEELSQNLKIKALRVVEWPMLGEHIEQIIDKRDILPIGVGKVMAGSLESESGGCTSGAEIINDQISGETHANTVESVTQDEKIGVGDDEDGDFSNLNNDAAENAVELDMNPRRSTRCRKLKKFD